MSFPKSRLGMAIGISAPCTMPRLNPAGRWLRSRDAEMRLRVHPMISASARIADTRAGRLHHDRDGETLACLALMLSVEQKHVFGPPCHASRIFRLSAAVAGRDRQFLSVPEPREPIFCLRRAFPTAAAEISRRGSLPLSFHPGF